MWRHLPHVTCPTSVGMGTALCLEHELCLKCHKSLSQLFVGAEFVENVACLSQGRAGLSQGLVGQARWSGWSCLPSPFNRRSNTVANVMCNKTHFYCSLLWASEWAQSVGNERYHTHREMADGKPPCAAAGLSNGTRLYGRNSELLGCRWEGNSSSHTLVDKESGAHQLFRGGTDSHKHVDSGISG